MRITDYYARPRTAKYGGVNTSRIELLKALERFSDAEITIINAKNGFQTEETPGIRRTELPHLFSNHVVMIPVGIVSFVRNADYVFLHEGWNLGNAYVALCCRLFRTPYIIIPHGVYDPNIVSNLRYRLGREIIESFVLRNAHFVNIFFKCEEKHINNIAVKAKTVIAPTGISKRIYNYKWKGSGDYLYYAGRLDVNHKGLDILVKAFAKIDTGHKLVLQGQNFFGGVDVLKALISDLNLTEKVKILPHASHHEIMKMTEQCVAFVHISRWESYGRSVVDALSIGAPTLISRSMNISTTQDAEKVFEIVELQEQYVIDGINRLLEKCRKNYSDANLRSAWIKDSFNWEKTVEILLSHLH